MACAVARAVVTHTKDNISHVVAMSESKATAETRISSFSDPAKMSGGGDENDPRGVGDASKGIINDGGERRDSTGGGDGGGLEGGGGKPGDGGGGGGGAIKRLDRTKSWGSAHIERLESEARRANKSKEVQEALAHVPFFSKLGYMLYFGEPIAEDNVHLDDDAWVAKMMAKTNWWVIHPFSKFRRQWDVFLMALLLYIALLVPFVIGFEVRG